jgi:hypothetical protein
VFRARALLLVLACELVALSTSCAQASHAIADLNDPRDDDALSKCRREGREARDAGAAPLAAYDVYENCKRDAGLP